MEMKEEMTLTTGVRVELGIRQTLKLLNAQAAFFLTVFPVDCPLALRAACLAWLVAALGGCRRLGLKVEE